MIKDQKHREGRCGGGGQGWLALWVWGGGEGAVISLHLLRIRDHLECTDHEEQKLEWPQGCQY